MKKLHNPKSHSPAVYIPIWLLQVPVQKISHGAKILYGRLSQWSNEAGDVYRSKRDLMEEVGVSLRTLGDLIKELKDIGLIDTIQRIKGGISHYIFYDHEWMYEPIKSQLVYKSYKNDPMQDTASPSAELCMGVMQDTASHININKINNNNNKYIGDFENFSEAELLAEDDFEEDFFTEFEETDEMNNFPEMFSTSENEKSDYQDNDDNKALESKQVIDNNKNTNKSDYQKNQTKNCTKSSKKNQKELNNILSNNVFQIPEQIIYDWVANRKKKKAAITQTAWNKITKELTKCKEQGLDPIETFETFVANGWQSFKIEWFQKDKSYTTSNSNIKNYW